MKQLFEIAQELQDFIEHHQWNFCFIGGLSLQRWGENRLTRDIDLTIFTDFGNEELFIKTFLQNYSPRRKDAIAFALNYRVLLLSSEDGVGIDISLAAMPFELALINRSSLFEFLPGIVLRTCSCEDLLVLKAFAGRPQDWVDIRGILVRQGLSVDRNVVRERLAPLVQLKEEPDLLVQYDKICSSVTF